MVVKRPYLAVLVVAVAVIFAAVSVYLDALSFLPGRVSIARGQVKTVLNASLGVITAIVPPAIAWKTLQYQRGQLQREDSRNAPDIYVEEWYPKEDYLRIYLSNLGKERVKKLGAIVLIQPWTQYLGPLGGPRLRNFEPEVTTVSAPLRRTDRRSGKHFDNYLQGGELDIPFEARAEAQIIGEDSYGIAHPISNLLDGLADEVKTLTIQLVLTGKDIYGQNIGPIRIATLTIGLGHPNHMMKGYELAAAQDDGFGAQVVVHPENFEELFRAPSISWNGNVLGENIPPSTNFGPLFTIDSNVLEDMRREDDE